ncbi:hypothetical protein [Mesorhizobium sp. WSM4884]|nr:hypothetical protein [Mesorhizobium sp. WSM4884]MDG4881121.1 hypothetical protein [Mesorhizobium sp. WSM4884]
MIAVIAKVMRGRVQFLACPSGLQTQMESKERLKWTLLFSGSGFYFLPCP